MNSQPLKYLKNNLILALFLLTHLSYAQSNDDFVFDKSNLDVKDAKGKKHGYWKQYLTDQLKPCKLEKAHYYGYELYDHGDRVQKFYYQRFKRRTTLKSQPTNPDAEKPMLLDGTFEWYRKSGKIMAQEIFKEGMKFYTQSTKFSRKVSDKIVFTEHLYFDKLYSGKVGTFYYEQRTRGQVSFKGYFRKRDRGWRVYGNKKSNPKYKRSNL